MDSHTSPWDGATLVLYHAQVENGAVKVISPPIRVLLVDDQEAFRSAARLVVELADGFSLVDEAETAEQALDLVEAHEYDLVLMDINLPGIDGLEATRRITGGGGPPKVIVLSTYEASEYESRARDAGAIGFISKSDFGPDQLVSVWGG